MSKQHPRKPKNKTSIDHLRNARQRAFKQKKVRGGMPRLFDDPQYIEWRKSVFARDNFKCKMPNCSGVSKVIHAHHIKRWADHPELRFVISNGITLCDKCHEIVTGQEKNYEPVFTRILFPIDSADLYKLMRGIK